MNILEILFAGIVGTIIMTSFLNIIFYFKDPKLRITRVLGSMLIPIGKSKKETSSSERVLVVGILVHYTMGVIFSIPYILLWVNDIGIANIQTAVLYGIINGLFAMLVWWLFIKFSSNPPAVPLRFLVVAVGSSYIFFALGVFAAHQYMIL